MTNATKSSRRQKSMRLFLTLQAVILTTTGAWAAWRVVEFNQRRALPALRNEPLPIRPRFDNPLIVSDEQLKQTLKRLTPRFRGKKSPISTIDHALRFWGFRAKFSDPEALSGKEMHRLLVDHERFVEVYGKDAKPLLLDEGAGVRYRTQEGSLSSSHFDHTLACLAEVGTPLDYNIRTPTRVTTVRAAVEQSLRDFSLNQFEYEWNAIVYALYMKPPGHWTTREGQEMTFDRLADRIMRERLPHGVCRGNHRMHALVVILRADEIEPILTEAGRRRVLDYLKDVTALLVSTQRTDGSWEPDWQEPPAKNPNSDGKKVSDVATRLLVTGHALEWWALAPAEVLPPRETLVRAGQWTVKAVETLDSETLLRQFGPLSHAGRALALWRAKWPHEVQLDDKPEQSGAEQAASTKQTR